MKRLYPYRRLATPVLTILAEDRANPNIEAQELDLRGILTDKHPSIAFSVELRAYDSSSSVEAPGASVVLACDRTDFRVATPLTQSPLDPGLWTGEVHVDMRLLRGPTVLWAVVAGRAGERDDRILAESDAWNVIVDDEARGLPNGTLPVTWVDFVGRADLAEFRDDLFAVDLNEPIPVLLLNSNPSVAHLRQFLPEHGRPPKPMAAVYESTRAGIARTTWMLLFQAAVGGINWDGSSDEEPEWPIVQWQADVLQRILPRVYSTDEADALRRAAEAVNEAAKSPEKLRELTQRAQLVVQRDVVGDGKLLRMAAQGLE